MPLRVRCCSWTPNSFEQPKGTGSVGQNLENDLVPMNVMGPLIELNLANLEFNKYNTCNNTGSHTNWYFSVTVPFSPQKNNYVKNSYDFWDNQFCGCPLFLNTT